METIYDRAEQMVRKMLDAAGMEPTATDEMERQVLGAYSFGIVNGYSFEQNISPVQTQAAMTRILITVFGYFPEAASQYFNYLVQCTDKAFHPTVNAIIHRGIEGYYLLEEGKSDILGQDVRRTVQIVKAG